jgi:hypothetical protein
LKTTLKRAELFIRLICRWRATIFGPNVVLETVRTIDYVLCTLAVEWIPSTADELWLTPEIPRICTPHELLIVLASEAGQS